MKQIENYVCTPGQAKRLKELGVEQESLYYFCTQESDADLRKRYISATEESHKQSSLDSMTWLHADIELRPKILLTRKVDSYSAFTSQELKELIDEIDTAPDTYFYSSLKSEAQWRAEFLIYLLENKK